MKSTTEQTETKLSTFSYLTPYERQIFIAELYHNAWYSQERYEYLYDLFSNWRNNPVKEKKFFSDADNNLNEFTHEK